MWYYQDQAQQQQGPVDDSSLSTLLSNGTITSRTLVWREGMANWLPIEQAPYSPALPVAALAGATCQICHKPVGIENLIELSGVKVCAACKPVAIQSLTEGAPIGSDTVWRDGKKMVAKDGARFPARCIKCNNPTAEAPLKRKLYWHNPFFYLFIFLHIIIYVVVAMIVRKKATAEIYMCAEHLKRRKYFIIGAWVTAALGFIIGCVGVSLNNGWIAVPGFLALVLGAPIIGIVGGRAAYTSKIKDKTIWLSGGGKDFPRQPARVAWLNHISGVTVTPRATATMINPSRLVVHQHNAIARLA